METRTLIEDAAERMLADHCDKSTREAAEAGEFARELWRVLEVNGMTSAGAVDSGIAFGDALRLTRAAGRHAAPVPLAEAIVANRLWTEAGGDELTGVVSLALARASEPCAKGVPWARSCKSVLLVLREGEGARLAVLGRQRADVHHAQNLAGEARDEIAFDWRALELRPTVRRFEEVTALLALTRACMIAGALEKVLAASIAYALERRQFGRPIAQFQAIQQLLAELAGEVAAAGRAADAAVDAVGSTRMLIAVAAAKARAGDGAGRGAEISHQVHGAIGFTHEHELHHFTRRLWAWRDEHGNEAYWQARLGRAVVAAGADGVWPLITGS